MKKWTIITISILILILIGVIIYSSLSNKTEGTDILVFKLSKDYSQNIPVGLSPDKSKIVAFKDSGDIYNYYSARGHFPSPVNLSEGYVFNIPFGKSTAFLNLTFIDWVNVSNFKYSPAPGSPEMYQMIEEKDPYLEIYSCKVSVIDEESLFHGLSESQISSIANELNNIIDSNKLNSQCRRIK